jgi:hypothetical protein
MLLQTRSAIAVKNQRLQPLLDITDLRLVIRVFYRRSCFN